MRNLNRQAPSLCLLQCFEQRDWVLFNFNDFNTTILTSQIQMFANQLWIPNCSVCIEFRFHCAIKQIPFNHVTIQSSCDKSSLLSLIVEQIFIFSLNFAQGFIPMNVSDWSIFMAWNSYHLSPSVLVPNFNCIILPRNCNEFLVASQLRNWLNWLRLVMSELETF